MNEFVISQIADGRFIAENPEGARLGPYPTREDADRAVERYWNWQANG